MTIAGLLAVPVDLDRVATQGALLNAPRQLGSVIDQSVSERSPARAE